MGGETQTDPHILSTVKYVFSEYQRNTTRERLTLKILTCSGQKVNGENLLVGYLFEMKIEDRKCIL